MLVNSGNVSVVVTPVTARTADDRRRVTGSRLLRAAARLSHKGLQFHFEHLIILYFTY